MSRMSNQPGFLPSIHSLSLSPINSFTAPPRSYNHSSDESETGSPSGGGGSSFGYRTTGADGQRGFDTNFGVPAHDEDYPFVPRRDASATVPFQPPPAGRGFAVPPEPRHTEVIPTYAYGNQYVSPIDPDLNQDRGFSGVYDNVQRPAAYSGYVTERQSGYDTHNRRAELEREHWTAPLENVSQQGHYRTQTPLFASGDLRTPSDSSRGALPYQPVRQAQSLPGSSSSSQSSGYGSPMGTGVGFHPSAFESASGFPDAGNYLRNQLNLGITEEVNLWSLPDPPNGQKPSQALPVLVKLAIYGSPRKKLTLQEIYAALEDRFVWFRNNRHEKAWKNSIRHNLSLNKVFSRSQRPITEPGKGSYWELDISEGEGYKRERKRRSKKHNSSQGDDDAEQSDDDASSSNADSPLTDDHVIHDSRSTSTIRRSKSDRRSSPYPSGGQTISLQSHSQPTSSDTAHGQPTTLSHSYPHIDPSQLQPQVRFGQTGFTAPVYRQSSFGQPSMPPMTFAPQPAFGQPSFGQQTGPHLRSSSRAATYPPSAFHATGDTFTPLGPVQPTSTHAIRGNPQLRSATEQVDYADPRQSGYDNGQYRSATPSAASMPYNYGPPRTSDDPKGKRRA